MHIPALFTCYLLAGAPGCLTESAKQPPKKTLTELDGIFAAVIDEIVLQGVNLKDNAVFLLPTRRRLLPGAVV